MPAAGSFDASAFVPAAFAGYQHVVGEALTRFLAALPAPRAIAIEAACERDGLALGDPRRLITLMRHCPSLHKFGQLLARQRSLDPAIRALLQTLESLPPSRSTSELRPLIEAELGPSLATFDVRLADAPLAEASVAIVVPCTWRDAPGSSPQEGVLKLLKPGILEHLDQELAALAGVAEYLQNEAPAAGLPALDYAGTYADVRDLLQHEVRLDREREALSAAAARYRHRRDVFVPRPLPFAGPNLLAMQRIHGVKLTDCPPHDALRRRLAATLVETLVADVIFSLDERSLFHADPHAGNLFAADDGRLAILDWSLADTLSREQRAALIQLIAGAVTRQPARIGRAIASLATTNGDGSIVGDVVSRNLSQLRPGRLPGLAWLVNLLDGLAAGGVRFPPSLLLMRKGLWLTEGVLADLAPDFDADAVLVACAARAFAMDWPLRFFAHPAARPFRTSLSNADLADLALSASGAWLQHMLRGGPAPFAPAGVCPE